MYRADHATGIVLTNTKSHFEAMRSTATIIQAKGRFHSKKQLVNLFNDNMSQTYETGVCYLITTGPISPEGNNGESLVKNLKHPTVFLFFDGRTVPLRNHSGMAFIYLPATGFPGA